MKRYAKVHVGQARSVRSQGDARVKELFDDRVVLEKYLPSGYQVIGRDGDYWLLGGEDYAGWTLDDYVIPRLGSGLIRCDEIREDEVPDGFRR